MITLHPVKQFGLPVVAECINPNIFESKTLEEIQKLTLWEGNKQKRLCELFNTEEIKHENETESIKITINGDLSRVRKIGWGMRSGELIINGATGMHLGEEMRGGRIVVNGNVGGWAGSMMKGGTIEIHGNAGDYLAAPYRGSIEGMRGGKVIVHGNVGNEAGAKMKKGVIEVHGSAGQFVGFRMCKGTIFIRGDCSERAGACMTDGRIIVAGNLKSVIPTFTIDSIRPRVKLEEGNIAEGPFYVFVGDLGENGNGKLYISKNENPQLIIHEAIL